MRGPGTEAQGQPSDADRLSSRLGVSPWEDRVIGCLLGCACGDIVGAKFEFQSRDEILRDHGPMKGLVESAWLPRGVYTDDTEMTLALASSMVECRAIDPEHCAATYAEFFCTEPPRGYGPAVSRILVMLAEGADYRTTGRAIYPEGSFANGGAMRIAPVGLALRHATDLALREGVKRALLCTHVHPDAIDGACAQAKAIARLVTTENPSSLEPARLLSELCAGAEGQVLRYKLSIIQRALTEAWSEEVLVARICTPNQFGAQFQIHAADAVSCALWAFLRNWREPTLCILAAVGLGGDTDTIAAMAGALAGALHGTIWIPRLWFDRMENAPGVGRDYIIEVARQLANLEFRD